ncbi:hypothetical protein OIDMADRAFT_111383, partial [Oidiodendron maius Zn]
PAVCCCISVLPGFLRTTTPALRNRFGKYSRLKLAWVIAARIVERGLPHAFRNPAGRSSLGPGAFQAPHLSLSSISSVVTAFSIGNRCWVEASS